MGTDLEMHHSIIWRVCCFMWTTKSHLDCTKTSCKDPNMQMHSVTALFTDNDINETAAYVAVESVDYM